MRRYGYTAIGLARRAASSGWAKRRPIEKSRHEAEEENRCLIQSTVRLLLLYWVVSADQKLEGAAALVTVAGHPNVVASVLLGGEDQPAARSPRRSSLRRPL